MSSTVVTNGMKVLIIDDDRSILIILSKVLGKNGYTVDTAESGQAGLDKLRNQIYSVALIDVKLQDVNGIDLLIQIREIAPAMKKIVLTGYPCDEDRMKALERGADYYLAKPVNPERLVEIMREKTRKNDSDGFQT